MSMKMFIEKRNEKIEETEKLITTAEKENRALTEDELKLFNDLKTEIDNLTDTINAIKEANKLSIEEETSEPSSSSNEAETRAFENYVRGIVEERAEVNMTATDNGAVIPVHIANKIISRVTEISPLFSLATKYNVKGTMQIPYYDESENSITVAYATEFSELESSSGKFKSIELKGFLAGALSKISKSLINNSQFNITNFIINKMAEDIAVWIENELLNGTADKIEGLKGVTQTVVTSSSSKITADDLIDVQEAVPDKYQSNSVWIMSKDVRKLIRKLKDSDGNYILNKDATAKWGYTLFGKDVYATENMHYSEGEAVAYYGDFSGLAVKISENISIEVLREKFATQHALGVVGWLEIDSKVENAQKIASLVMTSGT